MPVHESGTLIADRYEVVQGPREKPSLAGGMGLVYLCVDHAEEGRPVALKTFRPELLPDRVARDRFLREGTTWVELGKHPHVVRCHQVIKADIGPEVFFVLELVAATEDKRDASLRSWLTPGKPLSVEQALLFALHIARGMQHAAEKISGLVHRDLKPENVLVGRDGVARVTDFGLVQAIQGTSGKEQIVVGNESEKVNLEGTQLTQGVAGTPRYMAPEQWQKVGSVLDCRTDIYAYGCIVYEMLTGKFAINGGSMSELASWHRMGTKIVFPSHLSEYVRRFVSCCLCIDRDGRYAIWSLVVREITAVYKEVIGKTATAVSNSQEESRDDRLAMGYSYNAIGHSYMDIGKFQMAKRYFDMMLLIAQEEKDSYLEAAAIGSLGLACSQLGNSQRAIEFFEQYLARVRQLRDRYGEIRALGNLGIVYRELGDMTNAIGFFKQSLAIAREIGDSLGEGRALGNLGNAYRQLGDARLAIDYYQQALAIIQTLGDRHDEGTTLGNLGNAYLQLGSVQRAIELYEQRLAIARKLGDRHGEGQTLGNLGNAYADLGDLHRAIEYLGQRLSIAREIGDRRGEAIALGNLGLVHRQLNDTQQALNCYQKNLEIANEIGDAMGAAITNFNLALLLAQHSRLNEAQRYAEQAWQIFIHVGHAQYAAQAEALVDQIRLQLRRQ